MGTMQDKIITYLRNNKDGTAKEISEGTGIPYNIMPKHLIRLSNFRLIENKFENKERIWKLNHKGEKNR
jgi:predicted ArsR family transcriptional regulator